MARRRRAKKEVEALTHDEESRRNIPTAELESVMADGDRDPIRVAYQRRNRDLDPQLVWRGKDEQDEADLAGTGTAALHPGEGPPQSVDRRSEPREPGESGGGRTGHAGSFRRLQWTTESGGNDRVLPARPELVESDDPWGFVAGNVELGRKRGLARQGPVHLYGSTLRDQVQLEFPVVYDQPGC